MRDMRLYIIMKVIYCYLVREKHNVSKLHMNNSSHIEIAPPSYKLFSLKRWS